MVVQRNASTPPRPASSIVVKAETLLREILGSLDDIESSFNSTRSSSPDASSKENFRSELPQIAVQGARVKQLHYALQEVLTEATTTAEPILQLLDESKTENKISREQVDALTAKYEKFQNVQVLKPESLGIDLPKLKPNADGREECEYHVELVNHLKEELAKRKKLTTRLESLRKKKNDGLSALKTKGLIMKSFPKRVKDVVVAAEKLRQYCES